tara:strand:+ start:919 stop:1494 length:576 start_codon:yes stop_codon:yes gene_type:complete
MKKLAIIILLTLLFSFFVSAKIGSTGGVISVDPIYGTVTIDCELFDTPRNRIKCRLENNPTEETIPEPCRVLTKKGKCIQYYEDVIPCYAMEGQAKDECFKEKAGFSKKSIKAQAVLDNNWPMRYYISALLYDLEEMVEDAFTDEKIDIDTAADLIDELVSIKIDVLLEKPGKIIKPRIKALKSNWPGALS